MNFTEIGFQNNMKKMVQNLSYILKYAQTASLSVSPIRASVNIRQAYNNTFLSRGSHYNCISIHSQCAAFCDFKYLMEYIYHRITQLVLLCELFIDSFIQIDYPTYSNPPLHNSPFSGSYIMYFLVLTDRFHYYITIISVFSSVKNP